MRFFQSLLIVVLMIQIASAATNLEVIISNEKSTVSPGENLWFTTKLLSIDDKGRRDVTLRYEVLDTQENILLNKAETVAIQTQASFVGKLEMPATFSDGNYLLKVVLVSETENISAQSSFQVLTKNETKIPYFLIGSLFVGFLVLIIFVFKAKKIIRILGIRSRVKRIVRERMKSLRN